MGSRDHRGESLPEGAIEARSAHGEPPVTTRRGGIQGYEDA